MPDEFHSCSDSVLESNLPVALEDALTYTLIQIIVELVSQFLVSELLQDVVLGAVLILILTLLTVARAIQCVRLQLQHVAPEIARTQPQTSITVAPVSRFHVSARSQRVATAHVQI
ncbi:hypothetical protein N7493_009265 [Penicillium malachiteum]|uniref:Uncharacterized protein n=1 Tax=Penicillium malachiteum TaxID=1324776 RepID=A0AAD6HGB4_9EURO|nr:hypothetical protein N7493_009265 [Penicillium malachiteum]